MDPYACCYCGVTKQTQKQIVEHPTNEVKLKENVNCQQVLRASSFFKQNSQNNVITAKVLIVMLC
jgi:predicted GIY-YIG superfamily endonuclease